MMMRVILFLSMCVLALPREASGQHYHLSGTVRNSVTNEGISAANIRLAGTERGTIANVSGEYRLSLERGDYTLIASSLGYAPDTLRVMLDGNLTRDIALMPAEILMPEVVVTAEDPARAIMRRAIAAKRKWIDQLTSYELDAFTRQVLKSDTAIAMIMESYSKGYWQVGDTLREVISQRRQTENIQPAFNFTSVGRILNFNDDEVRFVGYTFVGPTAVNAFDYYDYKLLRTFIGNGREIHEIRMMPQSSIQPLFEGVVLIAGDSYALMGVDVKPNAVFRLPYVKNVDLQYRQQFTLYEKDFWMPADIRIDAAVSVGVIGFSLPLIGFSQTSVITHYTLNPVLPDSIFRKPRLVVDSSAIAYDSTRWKEENVLPLTQEEETAYQTLDSTKTLDAQFQPRGISISLGLGGRTGSALSLTKFVDLSFNRVEGLYIGGKVALDSLINSVELSGRAGYGFSDKLAKYELGADVYPFEKKSLGFGGKVYRRIDHTPDQGYFGKFANSASSLLVKEDYRDYFRADGWRGYVHIAPSQVFDITLSFISEWQTTVRQNTNFGLLARSRSYRPNPAIIEGRMRSIRFDGVIGKPLSVFSFTPQNSLSISVEHSTPGFAASQFDFTRYEAIGSVSIPTFGRSYLFPNTLRIQVAAGAASGSLPPQKSFTVESQSSGYAPFGVMRGLGVKELSGTSYVAINAEHNFRSVPFLALGIPFLYKSSIEFIIHGGAAQSWNTATGPNNGWYYEAGFGISRILELIRADFTWRLSGPRTFNFTIGVASLF